MSKIYIDDLPKVTPGELQQLLTNLYSEGEPVRPVLVLGPPGVGKTEIIRSCEPFRDRPFRTFYAGYADRTDIGGYPVPDKDAEVVRVMPTDVVLGFLQGATPDKPPVLFFDEVTNAPKDVQSVLLEVMRCYSINGRPLPDGTSIVAAGNLNTHGAGSNRLITSLEDRAIRVQLVPDVDDWCRYVLGVTSTDNAIDMVALVRMQPEMLHEWSPQSETNTTPRALLDTVRQLDKLPPDAPDTVRRAVVSGMIGVGRAAQYTALRELRHRLPPIEKVVTEPDTVQFDANGEPQLLAALASMLTSRILRSKNSSEFNNALKFLDRVSVMHAALFVSMTINALPAHEANKVCVGDVYADWVVRHSDMLF